MLVALLGLLLSACALEPLPPEPANDDIPDGPGLVTGSSGEFSLNSASILNKSGSADSSEAETTGGGTDKADMAAYRAWLEAQGIDSSASSNEYEDFQRWKEWRATRQ